MVGRYYESVMGHKKAQIKFRVQAALPEKSGNTLSLCNLCVLCVSVVRYFLVEITTEAQRTLRLHREEVLDNWIFSGEVDYLVNVSFEGWTVDAVWG